MSDLDAVIDLLERWRDATGVGRLRIGIDATRVIAQLPPARKRALAIEVARRVAPQLVPAIEAEQGDLTAEQVGALVDLLRRADREQLDELVTALRTGDVGGAAGIVGDAVDVVAGPDEETDALLDDIATADEDPEVHDEQVSGGQGAAAPPPPRRVRSRPTDEESSVDDQAEAEQDEQMGAELSAAAAAAAAAERDHVELGADGSLELDEAAVREQLAEAAAQRAQQYRDSSEEISHAPAFRAPEVDFTGDASDFEFPDTSVESVPTIHERLDRRGRQAPSGRRLAAPPVSATVASLTATPDGYQRRRAALAAIRGGRLENEDVAPVVRSFERGTDRAWVAGAALDDGLVDATVLEDMGLSSAAVARLRRRVR